MRSSIMLKNALNHFLNTTRKNKTVGELLFLFWLHSSCDEKTLTPFFFLLLLSLFFSLPHWSLSGAKSDMRHISPAPELSLQGPTLWTSLDSQLQVRSVKRRKRRGCNCAKASMWKDLVRALISAPLSGLGPLKCLYRTTCSSKGLQAKLSSGQEGMEGENNERQLCN